MTWREHCKPIIAEIIQQYGEEDMKLLRKKLREAYPYYERSNWPYKVWCDEIHKQLTPPPSRQRKQQQALEDAGQQQLF